MDFLNKGLAQLAELFRSLTPGARLLAGLLLAVVVVSVGYLFNHGFSGGEAYLMGGRPIAADELPAMEAAFAKAGLADYEIDGSRIRVPRGQQAAYMGALADAGALPLDFYDILDKELSGGDLLWLDKATREAKIKNARQQELALIIRRMSGIAIAAVQYDTRRLGGIPPKELTTASVSVAPKTGQPLDPAKVRAIRDVVAKSIAGMSRQDVAVIDLVTGRSYAASDDGVPAGTDNAYLQTQQAFQASIREELLGALSYVPGVVVTVNVELSKDLLRRTDTVKLDPQSTVPVMSQEESRTSTQQTTPPRGRPGIESNGPGPNGGGTLASGGGSGNRTEDESSSRQERSPVGHTSETTEQAPLTPERITVAVAVPSSYFEDIWRQQNPTAAGQTPPAPPEADLKQIEQEETAKIRSHVAQVVSKPANTLDPTPLVTVTTFRAVPPAALAEAGLADEALAWAGQYWSTLGMIGLGLFSLLMLRSMVRGGRMPAAATASSTANGGIDAEAPADTGELEMTQMRIAAPRNRSKCAGAPSPKDELMALVQDDPDAAANILRSWIGNPT